MSISSTLRESIGDLRDLFFPNFCLLCRRKIARVPVCSLCMPISSDFSDSLRCQRCFCEATALDSFGICAPCKRFPMVFETVRYLWEYKDAAQEVIKYLKYKPSLRVTKYVGEHLSARLPNIFPEHFSPRGINFSESSNQNWDLVIPIPASSLGIKQRGFSHTAIIAAKVAQTLRLPISYYALRHNGYKTFQVDLNPDERLQNINNAFSAASAIVKHKRVLLIDDVVTTGATSTEAATKLIKEGSASVSLVSLARSPTWSELRRRIYEHFQ